MPTSPPMIQPKAGGVTFNVYFNDVTDHTGVGFDDPVAGPARREAVQAVFSYMSQQLNETGACDVVFFDSPENYSGGLGASHVYVPTTGPLFTNGFAYEHITTGIDPSPEVPDIEVMIFSNVNWYVGDGPTPPGSVDLFTVLLHELTHSLGFASLSDASGAGQVYPNVLMLWDSFLETGNGKKLWNSSTAFLGVPSDLTGGDGGVVFTGPNAIAAFGAKPPVYTPEPFFRGSSLCHWNNMPSDLMTPAYSSLTMRTYSPLDIGALKDLGYRTLLTPLPGARIVYLSPGGWQEEGSRLDLLAATTALVGDIQYQWMKKDLGEIPGATSERFTIESLALTDTGIYWCVVTDQSKGIYETDRAYVVVFPTGSLPAAGMIGLFTAVSVCVLAGAFAIARKRLIRV